MDQQLLVRIGQTFEQLSSRLSLLDENGQSLEMPLLRQL